MAWYNPASWFARRPAPRHGLTEYDLATGERKDTPLDLGGKSVPLSQVLEMALPEFGQTALNYPALVEQGYVRNPWVYRAVNYIAIAASRLPWTVYRDNSQGEAEEVPNHPALKLLKRPNRKEGRTRFFFRVVAFLMLSGQAYIRRIDLNGQPRELDLLRPDLVSPMYNSSRQLIGWQYTHPEGQTYTLRPEEVLRIALFDPFDRDVLAVPPTHPAATSIDLSNAARRWNYMLTKNGAKQSMVFVTRSKPTEQQLEFMQTSLTRELSGPEKAGKISVLWGDFAEIQQAGFAPVDMDWTGGQIWSAREVFIAYGVPPQMAGVPDSMTYANYREARASFYEETVLPLMDWVTDELNNWLMPAYNDGAYLGIDDEKIVALSEDVTNKWNRLLAALDRGAISVAEWREATGYDPNTIPEPRNPPIMQPQPTEPEPSKAWEGSLEGKASQSAKARWERLERLRDAYYAQVANSVELQLLKEAEELERAIAEAGSLEEAEARANEIIEQNRKGWEKLLAATYMGVGQAFAEDWLEDTRDGN